jgi:hypothetical protein
MLVIDIVTTKPSMVDTMNVAESESQGYSSENKTTFRAQIPRTFIFTLLNRVIYMAEYVTFHVSEVPSQLTYVTVTGQECRNNSCITRTDLPC